MLIRLTTSYGGRGFNGTYNQSSYPQGCSKLIVAQEKNQTVIGTRFTKGNPTTVKRLFCYWAISAPSAPIGSIISVNMVSLSTDPSGKSFVAVYQGTHAGDPMVGRFYGTTTPGVLRIQGPNVYIIYQSEEDTLRTGFQARVNYCRPFYYGTDLCTNLCKCVQANSVSCNSVSGACTCRSGWASTDCSVDVDECLQNPCLLTQKCVNLPGTYRCDIDCTTTLNGPFGAISTIQYPTYPLNNAQCDWSITGGASEVVSLSIAKGDFQLMETAYCSYDSLNFFDGEVNTTNQIGRYCGTRIPGLLRTTKNLMNLHLQTWYYGSRKGFSGFYNTHECKEFTWGTKCQRPCTCARDNTKFCDNISGVCVCKTGWTGTNCDEDVNECRTGKCPENQACENIPGGYQCSCRLGFVKNSAGNCVGNQETCVLASGKRCSHYCYKSNNTVVCACPEGMEIASLLDQCVVSLYPYGEASGDLTRSKNFTKKTDAYYGEVKFSAEIPFAETTVTTAYIHNAGVISFGSPDISKSPTDDATKLLLKVFWPNASPSSEEIYYHVYEKCEPSAYLEGDLRYSPDRQTVMDRAARDVIKMTSCADFDVNVVVVATYVNFSSVAQQSRATVKNTFQAIFISGNRKESSSDQNFLAEETSYVFYLYPKDRMQWCNAGVQVGVTAGRFTTLVPGITASWHKASDFKQIFSYKVGQSPATSPAQQCQRYVCKNSRQITNPVYRQEIEQLYKCPCTLDRLGLQWTIYEQRSPNIYCFSISLVAKRRLLVSNPRNKLCCYRWDRPADTSDWQVWGQQLALATFVHGSPDAGHVVAGDPDWYEGVRENIDAHQWCCKDANKAKLCERFDKIYPDMECSYDVQFVPGREII
ncbi:uncharacterized protein LOC131951105 [Physella acuta]|uniref:uncharacterized protein LOC131951105 n=1 Tax=Physella acuta TaxID=109671 RepID=UPI0027DB7498|nr:uncharacterized protein LOC131951105 [Physella acuta]